MQLHQLVFIGLLMCALCSCGDGRNGLVTEPLSGKANAPVLSLVSGMYPAAQSVDITTDTPRAVIYYTTDGSNPSTNSRVYGGPVSVNTDLTLKAIAVVKGSAQSDIASANYAFDAGYRSNSGLPIPPTYAPGIGTAAVNIPGGLKVVNWAGFKAAISYTFDDSVQVDEYPALQATGERMTFFLICGVGYSPVWLQAARDGQELGNHTQHHCQADGSTCGYGQWAGSIEAEYDECTENIKRAYGVDNVWTTAAPFGDMAYDAVAKTRFFLNRGVGKGRIRADDNTDPFHLPTHTPKQGDTAADLNSVVDLALQKGDWRIFELHSLKPNSGWLHVDIKELIADINYTKSRGDVWIDSMVNVGAYWVGQDALENATETRFLGGITLKWQLPPHFPSGKYVRVIAPKGILSQGGRFIQPDKAGYYEVALDPGSLTILR